MTQPSEQQPPEPSPTPDGTAPPEPPPTPDGFVPPGPPAPAPLPADRQQPASPVMGVPVPQGNPPARGSGFIAALVGAAVVLVVAVVAGLWYLNTENKDSTASAAGRSSEAEPQTSAPAAQDLVPDGAPADPVIIESFTMGEAKDGEDTSCEYHDPQVSMPENETDVGTPDGDKVAAGGTQELALATNRGDITITVDNEKAPCTAASFAFLSEKGYFTDTECHRLTTEQIFVLQCGDPTGTGAGGPGYEFDNENLPADTAKDTSAEDLAAGKIDSNYPAGTVAMANSGPGTNGSQFFIVYADTYLPPSYTIFGTVDEGLQIVEDIADEGAVAP